jgi:tetratricopeptide (TPR) repeat protein
VRLPRPFDRLRPRTAARLALACALLLAPVSAFAQGDPGDAAEAQESESSDQEPRKEYPVSPRVSKYLTNALELMQTDRLPEAQAALEKIVHSTRLNPHERAKVLQFLGNVAVYQNRLPDAVKLLNDALALKGLDPASEQQVTFQLAGLHAQLSEYPQAMEVLDRFFAAASSPTPEAYYLKAVILVQLERPREAVEPAEEAVASSADPREGWLSLLSHVYYLVEDYAKMAATLERLIERNPRRKTYWLLLSAAYFELDREDDARATVALAHRMGILELDREHLALARLQLANGLPYECAGVVEQGMSDGVIPARKEGYELLTSCWLQARESDRALAPLARGAELAEDAKLYMVLAKVHLQREHYEEAIAALTAGLDKATPEQRGSVYLLIGVAQLGADRLDEAEQAFRSASASASARNDAESYLEFVVQERERRRRVGA